MPKEDEVPECRISVLLPAFASDHSEEAFIFMRNGGFINPEYFSKWIALPLVKKASEGRMKRFHDLRHFYASMLIAQGENPKYIQDQLGHASITTTFDTYGHLMPQARREASAKLAKSIFEEKPAEKPIVRDLRRKDRKWNF